MTTQIQLGAISSSAVSSLQGPRITTVVVTDNTYAAIDDTAVDSTSGGYIKITGSGFVSGCIVTVGNVTATSTTFVSSTEVRAQIGAQAAGSYNLYVSNPDGSLAIKVLGINYSGMPAWSTSSSQTFTAAAVSFQFTATSDSAVTYSVNAGSSLPGGLSLSSSGLLSGNATGTSGTVYTFTLQATDTENQNTPRTFTVTLSFADPYFRYTTLLIHADGTDGANNNVFVDSSNNGLTVTRNGTPTQGTFSPFSVTGWSGYLPSGSYLYNTNTNTGLQLGTGAFCIECWINPDRVTGDQTIINLGSGGISFNINASGGIAINRALVSVDYSNIANNTIKVSQWTHVAITRDGSSNMTVYMNGNSVYTTTNSFNYTGGTFFMGIDANQSTTPYNGYLSNIRVVKGSQVYTTAFTPSTTALTAIANTQLLMCQSNMFIDKSTNQYPITLSGTPSVKSYSPFGPISTYVANTQGGSVYCLSGNSDYLTIGSSGSQLAALGLGTGAFTIEFWIYPISGPGTWNALFDINTYSGGILMRYQSGTDSLYILGTAYNWSPTTNLKLNTWSHVALSRNGSGAFNLYVNGVSVVSGTNAGNLGSTGYMAINSALHASGQYMTAYYSNFRVVKGTAVYDPTVSTLTVPTTLLTTIANTSFLQNGTNAAIYDHTSKNNLITSGVTKVSNTQSKFGGSSVYMSGSYLYAVPTTGSPTMQFNAGDFTVETWVYVPAAGGYQTIFTNRPPTATAGSFWYGFYSGTLQTCWLIGGGLVATSNVAVTANTWTHVAATRQSGTLKLWVGGQLTNTYSDVYSYTDSGCGIGVSHNEAAYGLTGYLDDVRITKGYARYTSNFTPPTLAFNDQ